MTSPSKVLANILENNLCVGCGLCEGLSEGQVKMKFNEEGFLRPDKIIDDNVICEKIINVCPGHKLNLPISDIPSDPIWGPLIKCRTGYASDDEIRFRGSSGGGLSALVGYLLETGFADNVIQITADEEKPIYNQLSINTTISDVVKAAGSRYCPSAPLAALPAMLKKDQRYILVGKPCDIAGARQFIEQNPEYQISIVLLVSFMCGGMPSIEGTRKILKELDIEERDLKSFRYRGEGWPGEVKAETRDGTVSTMSYDHSWGNILRNYTQFRCKICPDAVGQFADVVFADAWHVDENDYPTFKDEIGRSIILTRTPLGEETCANAIAAGALCVENLNVDMVDKMQPYHVLRKRWSLSRMVALKLMGRKVVSTKNLFITKAAFGAGLWGNIRSFLGTLRRIILK